MNFKVPKQDKVFDRRNLILNSIEGKSVLHIGCTDSPFTEERMKKKSLLHQLMEERTEFIVGIDINEKDIKKMKDYGIENLYALNIYNLDQKKLPNIQFDYIVLPEVLEHLPDAGEALKKIRNFMLQNNKEAKLIVTVPNKHSYLREPYNFLKNIESIHPDHKAYYSYKTLSNILEYAGFKIEKLKHCTYGLSSPIFRIGTEILNKISSSFLPSIFAEATPKEY